MMSSCYILLGILFETGISNCLRNSKALLTQRHTVQTRLYPLQATQTNTTTSSEATLLFLRAARGIWPLEGKIQERSDRINKSSLWGK